MTRTRSLSSLGLLALTLLALPLRSDGGANECFTTSQSYDARIHTVSGDEAFFKLPVGPANVMLLLDNSGSMDQLVQCGDGGFSTSSARCYYPTTGFSTPAAASGTAVGSCSVSGNNAWMNLKDPVGAPLTKATAPALVDPGHGAAPNSIGLLDAPTWGTGCTGDNCLFNPDRYYVYGSWTETGAVSQPDSKPRNGSNVTYKHFTGPGVSVDVVAGATCDACLTSSGFCFLRGRYCSRWSVGRASCEQTSTFGPTVLFTGWWLNANPPKFMTARKVVKDVVWIDPTKPSNLDQARFGLAVLNTPDSSGTTSANRNRIIVPVGPGKADSFPVNVSAMVKARQLILDAMNRRNWPAGAIVAMASGATPIAPALARVGQYFASAGRYSALLGVADSAYYTEATPGQMQAPWASGNCAICWACQASAVILVTDGAPNNERSTDPADAYDYTPPGMRTYAEASYVGNCGAATSYTNCRSASDGNPTYVPRVAAWLNDTDLRTDFSVSNPQNLTTSAIGYGIKTTFGTTSTWNILESTAKMGGGKAYDAANPQELADSIVKAVTEVVDRANSFSAPAASSLSTIHTAASEAFITRFKPNETAAWEGHVFQGLLFDEFLNGCDPTKTPTEQPQVKCAGKMVYPNFNGNQDKDGFSICTDVFLVDADCDEVIEDTKTGEFYKKGTGNTPAKLVWDAGLVLSDDAQPGYRTARTGKTNSRAIWTWLPGLGGGAVDVTPANAAKLAPFLNLDKTWCLELLQAAKLCGGTSGVACPTVAGWTAANTTTCATAVINYVRGFDVLDEDGDNCGGPGVSAGCPTVGGVRTDGEERDRKNDGRATKTFWKLGDVFHSSPVLVKPPAEEFLCDTGYENQCLPTLRSPPEYNEKAVQTPGVTYDDAVCTKGSDPYEAWRYANRKRQRLVLIGANDGMLHAFDAGTPATGAIESKTCTYEYTQGTGGEAWAFVPTDLLPRLKDTLRSHQYMVDGSTMVRDVWVDVNADGYKQRDEYRTVAILTERSGGSTLTALDLTDPASPKYLWTFPPPGSEDQKWMG
ncbi:MAG: PilC/PilY family type IV pilus protein, partial [Anaeromyxobacteraceae bacterium]|nr:PilC/PilY family type IV pilus protein [Anaeromyxobacteraceae bacterium]